MTSGVVGIGVATTRLVLAGYSGVDGSLRETTRPCMAGSALREAREAATRPCAHGADRRAGAAPTAGEARESGADSVFEAGCRPSSRMARRARRPPRVDLRRRARRVRRHQSSAATCRAKGGRGGAAVRPPHRRPVRGEAGGGAARPPLDTNRRHPSPHMRRAAERGHRIWSRRPQGELAVPPADAHPTHLNL